MTLISCSYPLSLLIHQIQSSRLVETESSSAVLSELSEETEALRREVTQSRSEAEARLRVAQEEKEAMAGEIQGLKVGPRVDDRLSSMHMPMVS